MQQEAQQLADVWVPLGSVLLGALVGGLASLGGSVIVDRLRLRREMRIRIYDEHLSEATSALARWWTRSHEGSIDLEHNAALMAVARIRRTAVIAGKADRRQIRRWEDPYNALSDLSIEIGRLQSQAGSVDAPGHRVVDAGEREKLLKQVELHAARLMEGLRNYMDWLEKRIS